MAVSAIDISASGMRAQRLRMEIIANNLANVDTTSASQSVEVLPNGERVVRHHPYRRKEVVFQSGGLQRGDMTFGVTTPMIVDDETVGRVEEIPGHVHRVLTGPDKDKVFFPNVNPIVEMVDMIAASRAYEANLSAVEVVKSMGANSLRILA